MLILPKKIQWQSPSSNLSSRRASPDEQLLQAGHHSQDWALRGAHPAQAAPGFRWVARLFYFWELLQSTCESCCRQASTLENSPEVWWWHKSHRLYSSTTSCFSWLARALCWVSTWEEVERSARKVCTASEIDNSTPFCSSNRAWSAWVGWE